MNGYKKALSEFEALIGDKVRSESEAEWFYVKGQIDIQAERVKKLQEAI